MSNRLHLGCGNIHYKDFINIDIKPKNHVDVMADIRNLPFKSGRIDTVVAHHVFEHIPRQEVEGTLREWYRVLKDSGELDIECPDFDQNCRDYLEAVDKKDVPKLLMNKAFIYGGDTSVPEDGHRWGWTAGLIKLYLDDVGFEKVDKLKPTEVHKDQAACFRVKATK